MYYVLKQVDNLFAKYMLYLLYYSSDVLIVYNLKMKAFPSTFFLTQKTSVFN